MTEKKLYIKTYGCQMNVYDSGKMSDVMKLQGYVNSDSYEDADLVILNTCHIREKAAEKVYSELGRIRAAKDKMKNDGKRMVVAVAGCVAQAEGKEMIKRAPCVDLVVGPQGYQRLPQMVSNALDTNKKATELDFATIEKFDTLPQKSDVKSYSSFLTIQEGCDKFCTYCVVPYTRGAEYSRGVSEIYKEALVQVQSGSREITLLGQNVNAFHGIGPDGEKWNMGQLARLLADIEGLERIRYTTSHPGDMCEDIITAHRDVPEMMPFLHLPVQSGSDNVLKAMNRKHTADDYRRVIDKLRNVRPDIGFSSDFIVGFPGETDKDFEETLKIVEDIGYAQSYSFKYSARPGTPAAIRDDIIPEEVKSERLARLQALINKQQIEYNNATIGAVLPVLFDRVGRGKGQLIGRSPYMQAVHAEGSEDLLGKVIDVKIEKSLSNSVSGSIVDDDSLRRVAGA